MPPRIDGQRAIQIGPQGSQIKTPLRTTSEVKPLNFDVLRGVFRYLEDPRDIVSACYVSHLWHEAAVSRPLVAPWYVASNRAIQSFVRNKAQATDLFRVQKRSGNERFVHLLSQQTALRLDDVDQGLNQYRMQQAFAGMPALRALYLSRSTRAQNRGAAVMCWPESAVLHERVRRQSVPPEQWLGELPAHLTQLDLSRFSLRCTEEHAGRPVLENKLIAGLMQSVASHTMLTHLTLGIFDVDRLELPRNLTHLTLTRSLQAQQSHHGLALRLLRELPLSLTHLYASDKVSLAQMPAEDIWPTGLALKHLSIRTQDEDMMRLQHVLRAPLRSLDLTCVQTDAFHKVLGVVTFPATLRELRLDLVRLSNTSQAQLLSQLPDGLVHLSVHVDKAFALAPLHAALAPCSALRTFRLVLNDPSNISALGALLKSLPEGCRSIGIQGINEDARELLRRDLAAAQRVDVRID